MRKKNRERETPRCCMRVRKRERDLRKCHMKGQLRNEMLEAGQCLNFLVASAFQVFIKILKFKYNMHTQKHFVKA